MSRRKAKNRLKNLRVTEEKREEIPSSSYSFSVNLQAPELGKEKYFLGYKLKNTNQLWDWKTLEDIKF